MLLNKQSIAFIIVTQKAWFLSQTKDFKIVIHGFPIKAFWFSFERYCYFNLCKL